MNSILTALALLEDGKRWSDTYLYDEGNRCLLGALVGADARMMTSNLTYEDWNDDPNVKLVASIIKEQFPDRIPATLVDTTAVIWWFNDDKNTVFEDINLVMEKAAIKLDELV